MEGNVVQLRRAELERETASLWQALADPTRRQILDLLRDRPRITGDIAAHFSISRIAVMRHLEVLASAGLLTSRKRGRERWHHLNLVPLQQLHERWADPVAAGFASRLLRLQERVEARSGRMDPAAPAVDVALDVTVAGTPVAVFSALTEDTSGWWGHPAVGSQATGVSMEPRLGGLFVEEWEDGGGQVIAAVTGFAINRHLKLTGPFHFETAVGTATFDLSEIDEGTAVRFSFRAVGVVDPDIAAAVSRAWTELVGERLKLLIEDGIRLGIAPDPPDKVRAIRSEEGRR
jgi:DNA-binding transcriptional ArsR family regulator/uncharacterized protein YndB with AHSA1/START domain